MTREGSDTTPSAAIVQGAALDRLGAEGRVRAAVELSEAVRSILLAGTLARHPDYTRADAVRHIVREQYGVELESGG